MSAKTIHYTSDAGVILKPCSKCKVVKPITSYGICKDSTDGRNWACKECLGKVADRYYRNNKEKVYAASRKWIAEHREQYLVSKRRFFQRHKNDRPPEEILASSLRRAVSKQLAKRKISKKGNHTFDLLGYTPQLLRKHLEKQFIDGMTWDNYGEVWSLDHKIPMAAFNIQSVVDIDFQRCWCLDNLQPLGVIENCSKKHKPDKPFQPSLALSGGLT